MAEYIERDKILGYMNLVVIHARGVAGNDPISKKVSDIVANIRDLVAKAPAADVVPVVHGEWVHDGDGDWRCSSCRRLFTFDDYGDVHPLDDCWFNYCPTCGCRMDKDGE